MIAYNKIYNEDCLDVMSRIPDGSVDLIVTDPPYLMNYASGMRVNRSHKFASSIINDDMDSVDLIINYIRECYRILKDNSAIYCFTNSNSIDIFKREFDRYFKMKNIIIWVKEHQTMGDLFAQYGKKYEMIIYANKGRRGIEGSRISDVWRFDRVSGKKQIHQNQKPIGLIRRCIEKSSNEGDLVFDGFMGSGTTAIASLILNRNFIGAELDEEEYISSLKRISKFKPEYYKYLSQEDKPNKIQNKLI